jgi:hypothetical protein
MNKFWISFFVILASGTLALYYSAPLCSKHIMPFVPHWMKPHAPTLESTTPITHKTVETSLPQEPTRKIPKKKKEVLPEDVSFVSPALEGIYYARSNEHPGWGVTYKKTPYYNEKGAHLGTIESGEIFSCLKVKFTSSKGDLLECLPRGSTNAPLLIARKDAYFFTGDYNKLAVKQLLLLTTYYQLSGKIAERRRKILEESADQNPYYQASRTAYLTLVKHIDEAKALQQQLAAATDSKKLALDEQLRALKVKETGLKKTFEEVQNNFVEWKIKNVSQLQNPDTDLTIKSLLADKQKLIDSLPGLAF